MSSMPVETDRWIEARKAETDPFTATVSTRLRMAALILRAIFITSLLIVIVHLSMPQSSTLWTAYQVPSDVIRLVLGFACCVWIAFQLFAAPKDTHAHRTWLYLGVAAVPFTLICIFAIW